MEDALCPACGAYWDCDCDHDPAAYYDRLKAGIDLGSNLVPNPGFGIWEGTTGPTDEPVVTPFIRTIPGNNVTGAVWVNGRPTPDEVAEAWARARVDWKGPGSRYR